MAATACSGSSGPGSGVQGSVNVGLVVSLTGVSAPTAEPAIQGAMVALRTVNSEGLAGNRHVKFVEVDDGSRPDEAALACTHLVTQDHVVAIVGFESPAALAACVGAAASAPIPYFAASPSGAGICHPNVFVFGFTPYQQVTPLIDFLAHKESAKTFYIVGADDPASKSSASLAATRIQADGGTLVGTLYADSATVDYTRAIASIATARPDVVLDDLAGSGQIAFNRQFGSDPRVSRVKRASLQLDATIARSIGNPAVGIFVSQDYNSADPSPANQAWLAALATQYGDGAVPTSFGAEMNDATLFMASAIGRAENTSGPAITSAVSAISINGPRGAIQIAPGGHGYATVSTNIGRVNSKYAMTEVDVSSDVSPQACTTT